MIDGMIRYGCDGRGFDTDGLRGYNTAGAAGAGKERGACAFFLFFICSSSRGYFIAAPVNRAAGYNGGRYTDQQQEKGEDPHAANIVWLDIGWLPFV